MGCSVPRNDKQCVFNEMGKKPLPTLSSRGRKPVAIHCEPVSEETSRSHQARHDGLPRPSLRSLLAMTRSVLSSRGLKARGDPLHPNFQLITLTYLTISKRIVFIFAYLVKTNPKSKQQTEEDMCHDSFTFWLRKLTRPIG